MVETDRALKFIESAGEPVVTALAQFACHKLDAAAALQRMSVYQQPDGGWSRTDKDFQGDLSAVSTTWVAMQWLIWLGAAKSAIFNRTAHFVQRMQRVDGSWDEPEEIIGWNPPPWMMPGRYENQLWLTSAVCCKLAEAGRQNEVAFAKALDFLRQGWQGDRFPVFIHTHWMALPLFANHVGGSCLDRDIARGCKRFLLQAVADRTADPGDLAAIAYAARLAGESAIDLYELALHGVLKNQQPDGGFATRYVEKHRPQLTVDALFLLRNYS